MSFEKCLTLSTGHAPNNDPDFGDALRSAPHQYGFIVFVSSAAMVMPEWLQPIYATAVENSCTLIMFDSDADVLEAFKVFDW
jgi:hypothetical protein